MEKVCAFVLLPDKSCDVLFCQTEELAKMALSEAGIDDVLEIRGHADNAFTEINDKLSSETVNGKAVIMLTPLPAITDCSIDRMLSSDKSRVMFFAESNEPAVFCSDFKLILDCAGFSELALRSEEFKPLYPEESLAADAKSLSAVTKFMQWAVNERLSEDGVIIMDKENVYVSPDCCVEAGVQLLPNTIIRGGSTIKSGALVGPNTVIDGSYIGSFTTVNSSQIYGSRIGERTTVGPFAYIRPDCAVGDEVRIGDFVELKKSSIGNNTKISHLTYLGDCETGERVNFGCGCVTANYDGRNKYKTIIGNDAFIGCNTNMVAPVKIGNGVYTAAGSTVTEDVPDNALLIARAKEVIKEDWALKNGKNK